MKGSSQAGGWSSSTNGLAKVGPPVLFKENVPTSMANQIGITFAIEWSDRGHAATPSRLLFLSTWHVRPIALRANSGIDNRLLTDPIEDSNG